MLEQTQQVREAGAVIIALMSDIHANRHALEACVAHARREGAGRFVFVGDYVGYGGDPQAVVDMICGLVADGGAAVRGNHDEAGEDKRMHESAAEAARWSHAQLTPGARAFLADLPLIVQEEDRLYVHADASAPGQWRYIENAETAARSLRACEARIVASGHVHVPALYAMAGEKTLSFSPQTGVRTPLLRQRRWQVTLGAVGQPRDRDPAAAYALFDPDTAEIAFQRVPYDIEGAARAIRNAGLSEGLAARLFVGR
jgi:diadenosine tetraphosphatase ApaH/serine/threonine PP2A family protein phosphatase